MSTDSKNACVAFNTSFRKLFSTGKHLAAGFVAKRYIKELQTKLSALTTLNPNYLIEVMTPYLLQASTAIETRNTKYFADVYYDAELTALSKVHKFGLNEASSAVGHLKTAFLKASKEKQAEIYSLLTLLLSYCATYALSQRSLLS